MGQFFILPIAYIKNFSYLCVSETKEQRDKESVK